MSGLPGHDHHLEAPLIHHQSAPVAVSAGILEIRKRPQVCFLDVRGPQYLGGTRGIDILLCVDGIGQVVDESLE